MGRLAYGLGLGSVSWAAALVAELSPTTIRLAGRSPSPAVAALVHHTGPALLLVLPLVMAGVVFAPRTSGRRHQAAFVLVPFAFATVTFVHFGLYCQLGSSEDYFDDLTSLVGTLLLISVPAALVAAIAAALPLAPLLSFAQAGDADDHDARARLRVGACLAIAAAFQFLLIIVVLLFGGSSELWEAPLYAVPAAPCAAVFLFGLLEVTRSRRLLASLEDWLARVRAGGVPGLRIRDEEATDARLYLPDVNAGSPDDPQVLEAYAESTDAGPYRVKRSLAPLGRVPRA